MDATGTVTKRHATRGSALVFMVIFLLTMVCCLGLVIDLGHLYVVRGELQNAADASVLAGAWSLYKDPDNPDAALTLDFSRARTAANGLIQQNSSDGTKLGGGSVDTLYWNLSQKKLVSPVSPTNLDVPAVAASVSRSAGLNGGPVPTYFARLFHVNSVSISSRQAVAVSGFSGSAPSGSLFPVAVSSCMSDIYFNQKPLPNPPVAVSFNSLYHDGGSTCQVGQWTSFTDNNNSASFIKGLLDNGNTQPLVAGQQIWIQTGVENTLYNSSNAGRQAFKEKDVLLPIVTGNVNTMTPNAYMTIQGFVSFRITSVKSGSNPSITGYFLSKTTMQPGAGPGGSVSNTVTAPLLVN